MSPQQFLARMATLTEPSAALTDPTERRRARALTQLILLIVPVGIFATIVPLVFDPAFFPIFINNAMGFVVLTIAGFAARTRYFRAAAGLSVVVAGYMALAAGVLIEDDPVWWAHGMIVVLVATLLLSLRAAVSVAMLMTIGVMGVLAYHGKTGSDFFSPVGFYIVFAPLLIMVAYHRDIVERLRNEERLKMERQLAEAQRVETIGRIAGGIAHDFNNLLTVVISSSGLVRDLTAPTPEAEELLNEIDSAAERATRLTQQLLAYSRQQVLEPQLLDLAELVTGMRPLLEAVLRGDLTIEAEADCVLLADQSQLEQVLLNLIINARDAYEAQPGRPVRKVRVVVARTGETIRLTVGDDAGGMPADVAARVFEPYFTTRESESTGLGLSTVQGIVHQSHGEVVIDTVEGEGTTFVITLPCAPEAD